MIINFVGSPNSGKTTTAASLFARLKEDGQPAEFLTEQARLYIAGKRYHLGLAPADKLLLNDLNQEEIMWSQLHFETMLQKVCGPDMTVVTDSSFLNSLLYMTDAGKDGYYTDKIQSCVEIFNQHPRLIFICPMVKPSPGTDPNRIHSEEESRIIDGKVPAMLATYAPNTPTVYLSGSTFSRYNIVISEVFKRLAGCL